MHALGGSAREWSQSCALMIFHNKFGPIQLHCAVQFEIELLTMERALKAHNQRNRGTRSRTREDGEDEHTTDCLITIEQHGEHCSCVIEGTIQDSALVRGRSSSGYPIPLSNLSHQLSFSQPFSLIM